jgi:uncharacterized protein
MYERWRRVGGDDILKNIRDYNEVDCRSTVGCRDWLLGLRTDGAEWFVRPAIAVDDPERDAKRAEAAAVTEAMIAALTACPPDDLAWRELLAALLEFHRREAKPAWWAQFARAEMSEDKLIDDAECIGGLRSDGRPPRPDKRSLVYGFTFPSQDLKMRLGDQPVRPGSLESAGEIVALDEEARTIELKLGPSRTPLGPAPSLIPPGPIGDKVLREAVYRFAQSVVDGSGRYRALEDILKRAPPRLAGRAVGQPIVADGADPTPAAIAAFQALDGSYLLVQGPPGAGKTYTASHAIVALLAAGKSVGVASHSHKAINGLLAAIETVTAEQGLKFRGLKKSGREDQMLASPRFTLNTLDNGEAAQGGFQLVAGTAFLFARPEFDGRFDYLFVDEAAQVSLANTVAMGVSARNIVLIGDQMQLAQPIQGDHSGRSGLSALQHLRGDEATVPPAQGVFLPITRRMHPKRCRFISEAVYDGRLKADDGAAVQSLLNDPSVDPDALANAGLKFVEVAHSGWAQKCPAEADRLKATYIGLLGQTWRNRKREECVMRRASARPRAGGGSPNAMRPGRSGFRAKPARLGPMWSAWMAAPC